MKKLRLLMISQYGAGLSNPEAQFSGALARQKDYANTEQVALYHMIVPAVAGEEAILVNEVLMIHPIKAAGNLNFLKRARQKARQLHQEYTYTHVMVDNPHTAGFLGVLLKRDLQIPLVVHTMSDMIRNKWYRRERISNILKSFLIEIAVRHADVIRVSTQTECDRHHTAHFASKIHKVSFYVDQPDILKNLTQQSNVETQPKQLLCVGRLGPQKDIATLLKAMRIVALDHADAKLTIVGGGPDEAALKMLVAKLGLESQVTFTGPVPYERVMQYFAEAGAFVISSLHEGTCMVLHEAALAKKPIVSTAHSGALDLVKDGVNGYLAPVRDHKALAQKISLLLRGAQKAQQMGEANFAQVRSVDRSYALSEWQGLCERLQSLT